MKGSEELNPLVQLNLIASTESHCLTERQEFTSQKNINFYHLNASFNTQNSIWLNSSPITSLSKRNFKVFLIVKIPRWRGRSPVCYS